MKIDSIQWTQSGIFNICVHCRWQHEHHVHPGEHKLIPLNPELQLDNLEHQHVPQHCSATQQRLGQSHSTANQLVCTRWRLTPTDWCRRAPMRARWRWSKHILQLWNLQQSNQGESDAASTQVSRTSWKSRFWSIFLPRRQICLPCLSEALHKKFRCESTHSTCSLRRPPLSMHYVWKTVRNLYQ